MGIVARDGARVPIAEVEVAEGSGPILIVRLARRHPPRIDENVREVTAGDCRTRPMGRSLPVRIRPRHIVPDLRGGVLEERLNGPVEVHQERHARGPDKKTGPAGWASNQVTWTRIIC
jgi:hypothetical protein